MNLSRRNKELFKNTFLFAISNFASKLLVFLMIPLYTSVLSTNDYGMVDLITTTVLLLLPFFTLSIADSVLRFSLSNNKDADEFLSIGLWITLAGSVFVLLLTPLIKYILSIEYYWYIPAIFFTQSISRLFNRFARGIDKVKITAIAGILETFVIVTCNLFFLLILKIGILGYLLSMVIGYSVSCIFLFFSCNIYSSILSIFSFHNSKSLKELLCYSVPLVPNQLCWWMIDSSSKYFLRFYIGFTSVGIYTAAYKFPTILNIIASFFIDAWLLSIIKEYNKPDIKIYIKNVYNYFSFIILFSSLIIISLSKPISDLFLKGDFNSGWIYIPLMCLSAAFGALGSFVSTIFSAEKKTKYYLMSTCIGCILVFTFCFILVPKIGVMGVVIATLIGYIVMWFTCIIVSMKFISWNFSFFKLTINLTVIGLTVYFSMLDKRMLSYLCVVAYLMVNCHNILGILSFLKRR